MYKIITEGEGRRFEAALHFAVIDENKNLLGASFVGYPSAAWAINAKLSLSGDQKVLLDTGDKKLTVKSYPGLRHFEKRVEIANPDADKDSAIKTTSLVHVLILPRSTLLQQPEDDISPVVILSWYNDIRKAVGEYIAFRYHLPPEIMNQLYDLMEVEYLEIIADPDADAELVPKYAVRVSANHGRIAQSDVDQVVIRALKSGRICIPESSVEGIFYGNETMKEYLVNNAHVFANQVAEIRPLHDPNNCERLDKAIVMQRIPFPPQAHVIEAIKKRFKKNNVAICCGDMGTGKTITSLGVANVLYRNKMKSLQVNSKRKGFSVLITAPGLVVPKWASHEIMATLPDAKIIKIGSTQEAEQYRKKGGPYEVITAQEYLKRVRQGYKPEGLVFVLMSIDRAKLGPASWWGAALWKRCKGEKDKKGWHCSDCGARLTKVVEKMKVPLTWNDLLLTPKPEEGEKLFDANGLPLTTALKWNQKPPVKTCGNCGAYIMRPALKKRGETNQKPRWYAALTLKKLKKHFDLYISDEVHQTKAENSGRGFAFAQLVKCSKKNLCLTGTLVNGMSTSIKEIISRTQPKRILDLGFKITSSGREWVHKYGVLEKVTKINDDDVGVVTKRKRYTDSEPREKPGISPELVTDILLDQTTFLELPDMGLPLVKKYEEVITVSLDEEHLEEYTRFHEQLFDACKEAMKEGHKGAYAKFIPSVINAVDRADLDMAVQVGDKIIPYEGFGKDYYNAKERKLVEIVRDNLNEDRGCVVYCFYSDSYAVPQRLRDVLKAHGIDSVAVMESSVSPEARVEWLADHAVKGTKVIICNMRLVEVGLDLLPWPTIINYQLNFDVNTLRQANGRNWRVGQTRECRNIYLVAENTYQVAQLEICLDKRAQAMLTEGRLDRSDLGKYVKKSRMTLAADLAECIAEQDIGLRWSSLAEKDIENVEMVEETEFKQVLQQAFTRLANETMRLCGVEESPEQKETTKHHTPSYADLILLMPRFKKKKKQQKQAALPEGCEQLNLFAV